jgi:hypothetical protein
MLRFAELAQWYDVMYRHMLHQTLVGVDIEDEVAGRRFERMVASRGEIVVPAPLKNTGSKRRGNLSRAIGRAGICYDDLIDLIANRAQALFEHRLLIPHDHGGGNARHRHRTFSPVTRAVR